MKSSARLFECFALVIALCLTIAAPALAYTLRGTSTKSTAGTSLSLSAVAGTQVGDALVAVLYFNGGSLAAANNTVNPPSGWTAAFNSVQDDSRGQIFAFTKSATSADTAGSYTFTLTVGSGNTEFGFVGVVAAVGGANGASVDAAGYQANAASTGATSPSISPAGGADYLVAATGVNNNVTFTGPATMTTEASLNVSAGSIAYADQVLSASGATGTRTFTISVAHGNSGALIALAPAGAAPTPTAAASSTASATQTPTPTATATAPATSTPAPIASPTATATQTPVPTATATATSTPAPTPSPTATATQTPVPTATATATSTPAPTPSPTATSTQSPVPTATASATSTPAPTPSPTATATQTPVPTASQTATATSTPVASASPATYTLRGTSTKSTAGTSLSLSAVAGTQVGDALVAVLYFNGGSIAAANNTVNPPSGWTAAFNSMQDDSRGQIFAFTKSATSADTAGSYTFTLTVGSGNAEFGFVGVVAAVGGANGASVDAAGWQANAASTSATGPSISPAGGADYLVAAAGVNNNVTFTGPAAMTTEASLSVSAGSIAYADQALSANGTTGTRTFTISVAHGNSGALIALAPAGTAPTPTAAASSTAVPTQTPMPTPAFTATPNPTVTPPQTPMPTANMTPTATSTPAGSPTPIQHLIVIVGENNSFDTVFGGYVPPAGQTISNLLSKGIITATGGLGFNSSQAAQEQAVDTGTYSIQPSQTGPYSFLPQPNTTYATGEPQYVPDPRFPSNLSNGPFQITRYAPYNTNLYVGDPVHRFFQMWQQTDEGKMDLYVWTAQTIGNGPQSSPSPSPGNTYQGALSMGYYNMSAGDAPHFASMAQNYAISDNYHQAIMGGSDPALFWIFHNDVQYAHSNSNCQPIVPPSNQIEIPDAQSGTNNFYTQDGPSGGSYVNCADMTQSGVAPIMNFLNSLPYKPFNGGNCAANTYYLVNNTPPGGSSPACAQSIVSALESKDISVTLYGTELGDGINANQILTDIANNNLAAVSFVGPETADSGHPAYSTLSAFEVFCTKVANAVINSPNYVGTTAIFITTDESGGYYDSGYIQPIDFFGDGPRIPFIAISAYAKQGYVDHTYYDHSSISKFIERNWQLPPLSGRTRDNLPNPTPSSGNPYVPGNAPAIGDLMNLFDFTTLRANPPPIQ